MDQELVFKSVCQMMYAMIDQNHEAVVDKEQKVAHLEVLNRQLEDSLPNLDRLYQAIIDTKD